MKSGTEIRSATDIRCAIYAWKLLAKDRVEQCDALSCVISRSPFRFPSDFSQSLDHFPGCRWDRLRGQCWLPSWQRGRPLPCLRDTDDVWSIFRINILTAVRDHCLFGNSRKILLATHPFSFLKSFIAALSSFANGIVLSLHHMGSLSNQQIVN